MISLTMYQGRVDTINKRMEYYHTTLSLNPKLSIKMYHKPPYKRVIYLGGHNRLTTVETLVYVKGKEHPLYVKETHQEITKLIRKNKGE